MDPHTCRQNATVANAYFEKQCIPVHRKLASCFPEKPWASLQVAHKIKKASGVLFLAYIYQSNCYASAPHQA